MVEAQHCPPEAQLAALLDGNLPDEEQTFLAAHLEGCEACRQQLSLMAGESLAIPPAEVPSPDTASRSDALRKAMERLKAEADDQTQTATGSSTCPPTLAFLRPSANPRHLGRLDEYDILEVIGRGGMGIVLKARDPKLERLVAVKVLNPELASSGAARTRFLREARSAAAVTHEHVVTIHAVNDSAEVPFLVMEYIVGVSLEDRIQRSGHLRVEEILRIGMQAASGLAAAHAQGLVHRDIKPSNILLENGVERVKITDFGLARVVHEAQVTQTNVVAGTPQYMSPEQARGEPVDHRSDLFSLGCVMYAMCVGRSPFRAETAMGVMHRVCNDTPRPIREVNPEIPQWLADIVDRLLAKNPEDRFETASEVAELFGGHLAHLQKPEQHPKPRANPVPAKKRPPRSDRREYVYQGAMAGALVLFLGVFALVITTRNWEKGGERVDEPKTLGSASFGHVGQPPKPGPQPKTTFADSTEWVVGVAFSQDNTLLAMADLYRNVIVKRLCDQRQLAEMDADESGFMWLESLAFTDDGGTLVTCSPKTLKLWDPQTGNLRDSFDVGPGDACGLAVAPGGKTVVIRYFGQLVSKAWDLENKQVLQEFPAVRGRPTALAISPDGGTLAMGTSEGYLSLWNLNTGQQIGRPISPRGSFIECLAFSHDGKILACGNHDGTVVLWDAIAHRDLATIKSHKGLVYSVDFSPDGKMLVAAGGAGNLAKPPWRVPGAVKLWDVESRRVLADFEAHPGTTWQAVFSPDGATLATAGRDGKVHLWDIDELREYGKRQAAARSKAKPEN